MPVALILDTFLDAGDKPVSGGELARRLGLSRVSAWNRLEQLRREGFVFEAAPRVGYRLVKRPETVHPALLAAYLRRLSPQTAAAVALRCLPATDSTNDEAGRLLSSGEPAPFAVVASAQTAGRGRMGRVWQSDDPGCLYLSFGFRPGLAPERAQSITLAVGLRLCERLAETSALPLLVKWPNDILCDGRKIAGILSEARIDADRVRDIVVGVGLNVNRRVFPPELRDTAGSLAAFGREADINETAALCIAAIHEACERFAADGLGGDFAQRWRSFDYLAGKTIAARSGTEEISGEALGLAPDGALLVRTSSGLVRALNSGEVTLRPRKNTGAAHA
ncbi:MAG: biotin--[acetyl-CoA-carboxylase] ligase [Puniceicoccales bacterium]|jgi:BirA family biotin operon repressor/biotin-[acetyl-CoA-carboxylase] ligase|nr:biotin--[acetyl-CoA-carboxylase] ligase [Puniceicoccales bacterium]